MEEHQRAGVEVQLNVALDNMPGALVWTDEHLNVVFCNEQLSPCGACWRAAS